jgi:hypothetical protein
MSLHQFRNHYRGMMAGMTVIVAVTWVVAGMTMVVIVVMIVIAAVAWLIVAGVAAVAWMTVDATMTWVCYRTIV